MTFKIWDGSTWRDPTFVRRWNGSAWVNVGQASKWNGSAWEQVWPLIRVAISFQSIVDPTSGGSAGYDLLSTGIAQRSTSLAGTSSISGEWLVSGSASSYEVRATLNSGSLTSGTTGTWLNLGTSRGWAIAGTDGDASLTIEIRDASTLTVLDSANINLSVGGL